MRGGEHAEQYELIRDCGIETMAIRIDLHGYDECFNV
jgi:hypothetical protein